MKRARLEPDRQHTTSNHCQKPEAGAQFLPISAAVGREISAHARPGTGNTKIVLREGTRNSDERPPNGAGQSVPSFDPRFGAIGISAVAAALRYRSEAKNSAYAPVEPAKLETEDAAA